MTRSASQPAAVAHRAGLSVGFILAENFTLAAFSLFVDSLRLAADEGDLSRPIRCRWSVLSSSSAPIRASCGVHVQPTEGLADPESLDYLVVVGGLLHAGPQLDQATLDYLGRAAAAGITLAGVCTGSFVLCRAGLMQNRTCCVSWYHHGDFVREFPGHRVVADRLFLVDRDRITCSGGSGAADLAAFLIERHLGRATAQKSLHILQHGQGRSGHDAQPHPPMEAQADDERVRRALILMEQNLAEPLQVGEIAGKLGLSTRQIERVFRRVLGMGPSDAYRRLRLRYGRWLIENTALPITQIALAAGFADGAHFCRHHKTFFGSSPSQHRGGAPLASRRGMGQSDEMADRRLF